MLTRRRSAVLVGVLGVLALTLVATTLPLGEPTESPSGSGATGASDGGNRGSIPTGSAPDVGASPIAGVVVLVVLILLIATLIRSGARVAAVAVGGVTLIAGLAILLWLLGGGGTPAVGGEPTQGGAASGGAGTDGGGGGIPAPLLLVGAFLGGIGLFGAGAFFFLNGDDEGGAASEGTDRADPEAIGRVAGRAAERIRSDTPAADNAVYRCWVELTELADAEAAATYTPAEFASAAVEAGMDPDDVDELRELFEVVRYGDADPAANEDRALSVFERIESTYVEEGDPE